jgi:CHAT domain-containing protein
MIIPTLFVALTPLAILPPASNQARSCSPQSLSIPQAKGKQELQNAQEQLRLLEQFGNPLIKSGALRDLGDAYQNLNQPQQAIDAYRQSIAVAKSINNLALQGNAWFNIGSLYHRQCQYQPAIAAYKQAVGLFQKVGDRFPTAYAFSQLGAVQLSSGEFDQSALSTENAIQNFESIRVGLPDSFQISTFKLQSLAYQQYQNALIQNHQPNAALEIAERGRARAFVNLLGKRIQGVPTLDAPKLAQIQQIAKTQNATLVEYSFIRELDAQGEKASLPSTLLIWVIKPTGEIVLRQTDLRTLPKPLNAIVEDTRQSIFLETIPKPRNPDLQRLHQLLIQPIADLLPADPNAHVIFVPQESLFLVPFAALQDPLGKYLIEQHTILITPAIQVLELTHQQRQRQQGKGSLIVGLPRSGLIVGNPAFDPSSGPSLGEAETEANAIAKLLNTQAIIGVKATKTEVLDKMRNSQIIHLATHGKYNDMRGEGLQSGLALASDAKNNGILTASEILDLTLNANLVVLSACNSGRGEITGDGVIGLSRSFISAGVPSIVVSLWSIPNEPSTTELMTQFYKNLLLNPDKAKALRQAMLPALKKNSSPKNWAAFILIGESK